MTSTLRGESVPSRNSPMHQHHDSPLMRAGSCRYGGRLRSAARYICPVSGSTSHTHPVCKPRRSVTSSSVRLSASSIDGALLRASATEPMISSSWREERGMGGFYWFAAHPESVKSWRARSMSLEALMLRAALGGGSREDAKARREALTNRHDSHRKNHMQRREG